MLQVLAIETAQHEYQVACRGPRERLQHGERVVGGQRRGHCGAGCAHMRALGGNLLADEFEFVHAVVRGRRVRKYITSATAANTASATPMTM